MKHLIKSIALGLMMFLAVQVQAENNPKNGNLPNVEPVTNYVSAQPQDVQQTPCSVAVYNKCGGASINVSDTPFGIPCEAFAVLYAAYANSLCNE